MAVMDEDIVQGIAVFANLNHLQAEPLLHQSVAVVFAKHQRLAVFHIDRVGFSPGVGSYRLMGSVVEDDTVLQHLYHRGTLMVVCRLEHLDGMGAVGGHAAGKKLTPRAKAQLGRAEGVFHRAVRTRLGDESARTGGRELSLGESVDTIVEQDHVQVHVLAHGVDEMVAADGQSVAVAAHLPHGESRVHDLDARGHGCRTPVNGLHGVGVDIIRQSARAAYTRYDGGLMGWHADLGHRLL